MPRFAHAAESYWHLTNCFLDSEEPFSSEIEWTPSDAQRSQAETLIARHGLVPHSFVVLCPFTGADDRKHRKVWPGFSELAAALHMEGVPVVICPGPGEEAAAAALTQLAIRLPKVNLGVYGALFELSRSVVANDTGPGHLAAAAGARLISIYGPKSVAAWRPIGTDVQLFHNEAKWPSADRILAAALATS